MLVQIAAGLFITIVGLWVLSWILFGIATMAAVWAKQSLGGKIWICGMAALMFCGYFHLFGLAPH